MWSILILMEALLTIPVIVDNDEDISKTIALFNSIEQSVSVSCYNSGNKPLNAVQLQRKTYRAVKGQISSQMTITALRCVAGAYASAWKQRKKKPIKRSFNFNKSIAVYLIGNRGRDASFKKDGKLSIWTIKDRKKINYKIPEHYQEIFKTAKLYNSLTVFDRKGKLEGKLCLTIEVPDTNGIHPIGIDLNQTNTLVATNSNNETLFISGLKTKEKNKRNRKTRSRIQRKLANRKAEKQSTRSVRRLLKRLGKRISNRNNTFSGVVAKTVCEWAKPNSVLVFEDLVGIKKKKKHTDRKGNIRKSNEWNHRQIRQAIEHKALFFGHSVASVNPHYTSQICSSCGALGKRMKHSFSCVCGHKEHADINASKNIRNRFTVLRSSGVLTITPALTSQIPVRSTGPEALVSNDRGQSISNN